MKDCIAGTPARSAALLCHVTKDTAARWYTLFRTIIASKLAQNTIVFDGEVEADESYFGGKRKGKRGLGS